MDHDDNIEAADESGTEDEQTEKTDSEVTDESSDNTNQRRRGI